MSDTYPETVQISSPGGNAGDNRIFEFMTCPISPPFSVCSESIPSSETPESETSVEGYKVFR